jgi:hypothetical protein
MFFSLLIFGRQKATTFQKAIDSGISIKVLDSLYKPALSGGPDSLQAVFYGKQAEFYAEYVSLLKALSKHLKSNNFSWNKNTRCFNRIYINQQGTIDYFLFNFKPGDLTAEKEQQFETLLGEFIKDYKFPLPASSKFAQCSPVTYSD